MKTINNNYNELCKELEKIRGAEVYESDEEQYVELAMITDDNINKAIFIITEYGYEVIEQHWCSGSDYDSYCIWFV